VIKLVIVCNAGPVCGVNVVRIETRGLLASTSDPVITTVRPLAAISAVAAVITGAVRVVAEASFDSVDVPHEPTAATVSVYSLFVVPRVII
jgi:hypothetical protein